MWSYPARVRLYLCLGSIAVLSACATLPEVHPWFAPDTGTRSANIVGPRGQVPKDTAEAILARLEQKGGGADVLDRHVIVEEAVARVPLTVGNAATLLQDGPATYKAMFSAMERARDHVNIEFYMIEQGETGARFADLLLAKRAQGVAINVIYDAVGSLDTPREYFQRLRDAGVKVLEYNPVNPLKARAGWRVNNRNHTKLVIVDGTVAFTGGINISDVYSSGSSPGSSDGASGAASAGSGGFSSGRSARPAGKGEVGWRDANVRVEGPIVAQLQRLFLDTWAEHKGEPLAERKWFPPLKAQGEHPVRVVASSPGDAAPAIYVALVSAIAHAEKTIHITMAYFVPDPQTVDALKSAAARGVDVVLVLPSHTDFWAVFHAGRSYYADLLEAGVKIYERQSALLHSKTIVIDGVWSTVGSSNMDWRSFLHNKELNLVVLGRDFGRQMEAMFEDDLRQSLRVDVEAWSRRPLGLRVKEWTARLWEYWL
jgi:cardiolipin synthase